MQSKSESEWEGSAWNSDIYDRPGGVPPTNEFIEFLYLARWRIIDRAWLGTPTVEAKINFLTSMMFILHTVVCSACHCTLPHAVPSISILSCQSGAWVKHFLDFCDILLFSILICSLPSFLVIILSSSSLESDHSHYIARASKDCFICDILQHHSCMEGVLGGEVALSMDLHKALNTSGVAPSNIA